jgi:SPP1 family predicted phage head-tail adaptor
MNAGKYKHRVTIQEYTKVDDGGGGYTEDWVDVTTVWAKVTPLSGNKLFQAQQINAEISHEVEVRYRELSHKNRLMFNNRVLNIESVVDVDEAKRELKATCKEVVE